MSTGTDWSPAHQLCAQEQTNQEKNEVKIHYSRDHCKLFQSIVAELIQIGMGILDLGEIRIRFRIQFQIVCELKICEN
jgi:hypothetical protein